MAQATITVQGNTYKTIDINDNGMYDIGTVFLQVKKDINNKVISVDDTKPLNIIVTPLQ